MKIEEIKKNTKDEVKKNNKSFKSTEIYQYWFPLSKGYNRLLIVLSVFFTSFIACSKIGPSAFIFVPLIEFGIYIAIIWVYRGFRDL